MRFNFTFAVATSSMALKHPMGLSRSKSASGPPTRSADKGLGSLGDCAGSGRASPPPTRHISLAQRTLHGRGLKSRRRGALCPRGPNLTDPSRPFTTGPHRCTLRGFAKCATPLGHALPRPQGSLVSSLRFNKAIPHRLLAIPGAEKIASVLIPHMLPGMRGGDLPWGLRTA